MFGKELFIRFAVSVVCELFSVCAYASFPLGFAEGMWDFIVLIPILPLFTFSVN